VPLVAVARTPVFDHRVVRVALDDGAGLEVSAPHPLADGRPLGALRAGEQLDGHTIVAAQMVDYPYAYTHDILPASDSGTYLAAGLWLGSTLHRVRDSAVP
jgi:hypothetical protein